MTITLHLNRTYRTRDGKSEYRIDRIDYNANTAWAVDHGHSWWADTGRKNRSREYPEDLVEEVPHTWPMRDSFERLEAEMQAEEQPASPVRQRTVTTTEIRPGLYGRVMVSQWVPESNDKPVDVSMGGFHSADELDAAAATLTQLAAGLRAIKAEQQS